MEGYYEERSDQCTKRVNGWVESHIRMPAHFHNSIEVMYCAQGELSAEVEDKNIVLHPGEFMLCSSFDMHAITSVVDGEYYTMQISRSIIPEWDDILTNHTFADPVLSDDEDGSALAIIRLVHRIQRRIGSYSDRFADSDKQAAAIHSLGISLMHLIMDRSTLVPRRRNIGNVPQAVSYIQQHFHEKLLLSDISRALLCNSQQLSIDFRETMRIGVGEYITGLRTQKAYQLIQTHPELSVSEIAEESGFQSMRSMLRAFRDKFGRTPSEMRQGAVKSETSATQTPPTSHTN